MAAPLNLEDVQFDPEDALVTDEDLIKLLPKLERVLSSNNSFNSTSEISRVFNLK